MTKKLYLMRHGQTLFNQMHKIQGWCDSPLTEAGFKQAQAAGRYFKEAGIHFDAAFCSTAERTSDTLEIATNNSLPYTRLKGLREWGFGRFEGQDEALNPPAPYGDFFKYYGGESQSEVEARLVETLTDIMEQTSGQNILAVSHGGALINFYWGISQKRSEFLPMTNCAICIYDFTDGHFTFKDLIQPTLLYPEEKKQWQRHSA